MVLLNTAYALLAHKRAESSLNHILAKRISTAQRTVPGIANTNQTSYVTRRVEMELCRDNINQDKYMQHNIANVCFIYT